MTLTFSLRAQVSSPPPAPHRRTHTGQQHGSYVAECWCIAVLCPEDSHTFRGDILQQWKVRRPGDNPHGRMAICIDLHTTDKQHIQSAWAEYVLDSRDSYCVYQYQLLRDVTIWASLQGTTEPKCCHLVLFLLINTCNQQQHWCYICCL